MLVAGNWKMHTDRTRAIELARGIGEKVPASEEVRVAVCPPAVHLEMVRRELQNSPVYLGAQTMHFEKEGAFTGELSGPMLRSYDCTYVILGHSERRAYLGISDEDVRKRVAAALDEGLRPIICVGEQLEDRKAERQEEVVRTQLREGLRGIRTESSDALVIAYEPVWAIGTGETATPEQAQEMHAFIREELTEIEELESGADIEILYGGSMKPHNALELLQQPDVDGGLIGGASLKADDFAAIVSCALEASGASAS